MNKALKIFKALADPTRLKIIQLLMSGEKCVCEILPCIKRAQSTASIQLKKLEEFGLIKSERRGKYIYYDIKETMIYDIFKLFNIKKIKTKVKCKV